ncbi:MAG: glycoside hydrolase family 78 protein [Ruminococcus flavefaciens]|nr:glycoside hydrolase family 78 protein [Ruminococcus flavefaciens]
MKAIHLRTEYMKNPIGLDCSRPKLFWNCADGERQSAYRIYATDDEGRPVWDSGKVADSRMTHIPFPGKLLSKQRILWKVKLWDEKDSEGEWSEQAFFEMGFLSQKEWQASWIRGDYKVNRKNRYPVDCFRREFVLKKTEIKKARLYITACGIYEAYINGERAGRQELSPGHTDYNKRIQYQTIDVTESVKPGKNAMEVFLADGWYRGSIGAWGLRNQYGTETKFIAELHVWYQDDSTDVVRTDGTWDWSNDGPARFADLKDGEKVDARKSPEFSGKAAVTAMDTKIASSNNVPVTKHEVFTPKVLTTPSGRQVLDFGQNIAGFLSFDITAKEGQRMKIRCGELIGKDGELTLKNIQCSNQKITTPLQEIKYICKEGRNHYEMRFAIFGFQYAEISGDIRIDGHTIRPENFRATAVYSDLETVSEFDSSNELLNQFFRNTLWSTKNNSCDVPTDCPTRERHGWTGDSQLFAVTAGYLMNYIPFEKKHVRDMNDWQRKDGAYPQIAPAGGVDFYMHTMNGSVGWADAGILIPYRYALLYGDRDFLEENYEGMKRYADFMIRRCGKKTILSKPLGLRKEAARYAVNYGQSYGEWAEPADVWPNNWTDMILPHPEVSTAYTAYVLRILSEVAEMLGKQEDRKFYHGWSEKVKKAYQELVEKEEFSLDTDRQANLVRPLYMGLLKETQKEYAKKRLLQAMEHYGYRLGTGFLSTPFILYVLSEIDIEAAYRLLENEEMPGWLFMPKSGANTVWESWEGPKGQGDIASLDHYSKGACLEWVFRCMCGIKVEGENHFRIEPQPGGHFTYADYSYRSIYGRVSIRWEKKGEGWHFKIHIPANTTARIRIFDVIDEEVPAGEYQYECIV